MRSAMQCTMSGRSARTIRTMREAAQRLEWTEAAPLVLQRHHAAAFRFDARGVIAHARRDHDLKAGRRAVRAIGRKWETKNQSSVTR
jgi:hypothetical protein